MDITYIILSIIILVYLYTQWEHFDGALQQLYAKGPEDWYLTGDTGYYPYTNFVWNNPTRLSYYPYYYYPYRPFYYPYYYRPFY